MPSVKKVSNMTLTELKEKFNRLKCGNNKAFLGTIIKEREAKRKDKTDSTEKA